MTDIKQGDTVDVSFRGKVRYNDVIVSRDERVLTVLPEGDDIAFSVYGIRVMWVTKVEQPVQAGDEVTSEQARQLPVGSTVLFEPGGGVNAKVSDTEWISVGPHVCHLVPFEPVWANERFKVLHVGGS